MAEGKPDWEEARSSLQERLGVAFRDETRLAQALRHRSAVLDRPRESNERMEFLGDAIVGLVTCDLLFSRFPEASEGELAKSKAYLVSEPSLAKAAYAIGLQDALEMSASEEASGGRVRRSILSDAFEAVVGAIYIDRGFRAASRVVRRALSASLKESFCEAYRQDFKSALQEKAQASARRTPQYRIVAETGADHDKTFRAQALLGRKVIGEGAGKSKKEAEQAAARAALEALS